LVQLSLNKDLLVIGPEERAERLLEKLSSRTLFSVVAGSTKTSTIPGISIAGPSPEATLYTPTLDVEYLLAGKPVTLDVVPVSPEGLPTPALITRAVLEAIGGPVLVVNAGCAYEPRVPHVALPSRRMGGRIDEEPALPRGTARKLYEEARLLGSKIARRLDVLVVGETIPGGTTVAAAIVEALGYRGLGRVSSSSAKNPHDLRTRVVLRALERIRGLSDVFEKIDEVGDPVHVSIAGLARGAAEAGAMVGLAGGTQMAAVLAILARTSPGTLDSVGVLTTPWIVNDTTSDMAGLVRDIAPSVPVIATRFSFQGTRYSGLRAYDEGFVKEGVGAGGALVLGVAHGLGLGELRRLIEEEYERVLGKGKA